MFPPRETTTRLPESSERSRSTSEESRAQTLPQALLKRQVSVDPSSGQSTTTWRIKAGVKPSKALKFACKVFTWMETFGRIRAKDSAIVPFNMNAIQQILAQYIAWRWQRGLSVRIALPKSRQMGSSTFFMVLNFALCELMPGYRMGLVAHVEDSATEIFDKAITLRKEVDKTDWDPIQWEQTQAAYLKWHSESSMACATIKTGDALGRGGTLSGVHFSESASYADKGVNARGAVVAILQSVAETRWRIEVHESTAKGKDPFFWPLCEDARDPNKGSAYQLIFLPWFLEAGYQMSWGDYRRELLETGKRDPGERFVPTQEESALRRRLAETAVEPHERLWRYQYVLSDEQLIWRRHAIVNKCWGNIDSFRREYPTTYEEAFTASASCMFEEATVEWYRERARDPIARGDLSDGVDSPLFVTDPRGACLIWEMPQPGSEYVMGVDPGGLKANSDPSCAYVVNKHTMEVVAQIHGHFEWDHFIDHAFNLGIFYNKALLVVENNHNPASANRCHRREYPNLYYYFEENQIAASQGKVPGFNTNRKTRPQLLNTIKKLLRERTPTIPDKYFWREMETFVWVPKSASDNPDRDGDFRAVGANHDDRIMALAIALFLCPQIEPQIDVDREIPEKPTRAYLMYLELKKGWEQEANDGGEYLNLGSQTRVQRAQRPIEGTWNASPQ